MQQLRKGYIFEGKYRIEGELGRGGFGMVYQAHQIGMERAVALKVLNPDMSAQAARTARERFMREVRIISKLKHPNTVTIHDFGETIEGMVYMVLEFVDGETLKDRLRRQGAMEESRAIRVAVQIARSLSEAHRHGIIHRDLKPANIMLMELGSDPDFTKVLDFGVARLRSADPAAELTSHGLPPGERELIGTPRYMSPEQVRGEELTGASDVYSLGLILYEMLTGEAAVQGDTTMALITQQISPEPLRMLQLQSIHPHLQHILRHTTEKRLDVRYRTVDVLAQELEQAAEGLRRQSSSYRAVGGHEDFLMGNQHDPMMQSGMMQSGWQQHPQQGWGQPPQQPHPTMHGWGAPQDPAMQSYQSSGHHPYAQQPMQQPMQPPEQAFGQAGGWAVPTGPHQQIGPMGSPTGGYGAINPAPYGAQQGWGEQPQMVEPQTMPHMPTLQQNQIEQPNIRESTLARIAADLPPPPVDFHSAFAPETFEPEPLPDGPAPVISRATLGTRAVPPRKEDDTMGFTIALTSTLVVGLLMLISYYLAFITIGAAVTELFRGPLRLIITVIASLVIPAVPLIAEGGKRERFQVVYNNLARIRKALTVGMIGSTGSFILIAFIFPATVMRELRGDPNWFLGINDPVNEGPVATLNRTTCGHIADLIEESTKQVGLYKPPPEEPKPVITGPPAPTRPAADIAAEEREKEAEREKERERLRPKGPAPTRPGVKSGPPSTRPSRDATRNNKADKIEVEKGNEGSSDKPAPKPKRDDAGGGSSDYVEW